MNKDSFTFSIQEAETLGIECAIVLAASKEMKISSSADNRVLLLLKEKIGSKSAGAYKKIRNDITTDLNILFDFFISIIS